MNSFYNDSFQSVSAMNEDFAAMDPTILEGYNIKFNREVKVTFLLENGEEDEVYIVRFRIFEKSQNSDLDEVRLEMAIDNNIGLFLECNVSASDFEKLKTENRLRVEFKDFSRSVQELLERSVKKSQECFITFKQGEDFGGELTFLQKLKLRKVNVFALHFSLSNEDFVRKQVQYRFNKIKLDLRLKDDEINTQIQRISEKNPSLAKSLQNSVTAALNKKMHK
ncbi:hypothetical protein TRFO_24592 [Tritrichomonas foetus]|uniref:Spindle assembly abnormal protein 6 N-terminal domain-containing protein n=1 Tax=Tritrichomonas foetus TaxID=1144522 RepID=A0A1J4K8R0_9EUKA|nr:hypothetical protein TRFO_24592 [Tritrichomonas foetus]|eukprot:OHT07322.1 hypothetical protein TRFO_24592 [Tritrichomonas foetus]